MKKYGLHCSKPQRYLKITSFPGRLVLASILAFAHFLTGGATAATISFVGVEQSTAPAYAVQNWSSPSSPKTFDLGGSEVYGTAGYYQIRPTPNSSPTGVNEAAGAGNNLGVTAVTNPTLSSAPVMLSAITGDAGTFVNYGGYPTFLGPDGSTVYRQGSLSLAVVNGPYDTPSGANSGFFGEAFNGTQQFVSWLLLEEDFLFVKYFSLFFRKIEISAFLTCDGSFRNSISQQQVKEKILFQEILHHSFYVMFYLVTVHC
jgi:hypothetical protein